MKRVLSYVGSRVYYYYGGIRRDGLPLNLIGEISPNLRGDLDEAEITEEDRNAGINIDDLIKED